MKSENFTTLILSVFVSIVLGGLLLVFAVGIPQDGRDGRDGKDGLGAAAGPDVYNRTVFYDGLASGSNLNVSTSAATYTLTDAELDNAAVITITAEDPAAALALTLPASSTWSSLPKGVKQSWVIDNLHSTAATTTTVTAGTGVDIDGTTANDDIINGGVSGRLECWRLQNTNIRCIVEEMVDAG